MNGRDLLLYNATNLTEWGKAMSAENQQVLFAVGMDSVHRMSLYIARKDLTPDQIAKQLRAMADNMEKNAIRKI